MMQEVPNQYAELKKNPEGVDGKIAQEPRNKEISPEAFKQFQGLKRIFYPSEGVNLSLHES